MSTAVSLVLSDLAVNKNLLWVHILPEGISVATVFFIELLLLIFFVSFEFHFILIIFSLVWGGYFISVIYYYLFMFITTF